MARGYQSYRGRRSGKHMLLVAVLVLILIAAGVFWFIQSCVTYTDDGGLRIDPPWGREGSKDDGSQGEGTGTPEGDTPGINLIVEGDNAEDGGEAVDTDATVEPEESTAESETVEAVQQPRHLLELGEIPQESGVLEQALGQTGTNGFVCTVRDNTGRMFYASALAQPEASANATITMETLTSLCAGESMAVARFNCFHDSYFAFVNMENAGICQNSGYIWYDWQSYHWLDPDKDDARTYVIGLAVECAQMGFDELLLDEMMYPTEGNLYKINYANNSRTKEEALNLFLTELRAALEPYGTKVSLLLYEDWISAGNNAESGQNLTTLLPMVDAVYAQVGDTAAIQARISELCPENTPVFVPLTAEAVEGSYCIAAG